MVKVTVLCMGALKEDYLARAVAEYEKRLSAFCQVEIVQLREEKLPPDAPEGAVRAALEREGERLGARIPPGAYTVALCVEGEMPDSEKLADILSRASDTHGKICFLIGSAYGLSPAVKARADYRLSLSRLTMPHILARVVLMEAVYRSFMIRAGKPYHR